MDEHEKALNILISKLGDTKEAEHYCTINSRVCSLYMYYYYYYLLFTVQNLLQRVYTSTDICCGNPPLFFLNEFLFLSSHLFVPKKYSRCMYCSTTKLSIQTNICYNYPCLHLAMPNQNKKLTFNNTQASIAISI